MRSALLALTLVACVVAFGSGCGGSSAVEDITTVTLTGILTGGQEVPPVATATNGSVSMTYDTIGGDFTIKITVNGLMTTDITGFHIHDAPVGVNGAVIVDLGATMFFADTGSNTITAEGTAPFPNVNATDLLAGDCYVNVHTTANPSGELRAQLIASP